MAPPTANTLALQTIASIMMAQQFCIRVIACFIRLDRGDLADEKILSGKIHEAATVLRSAESALQGGGYQVQTLRIVTNPFGTWMDEPEKDVPLLDSVLSANGIEFCAVGPATTPDELEHCIRIVRQSHRLSCSASLQANDSVMATKIAETVRRISMLEDGSHVANGLGNFRFCAATCDEHIPFFPAAKASQSSGLRFAVGLENGCLAGELLRRCGSIAKLPSVFADGMSEALLPVHQICETVSTETNAEYLGMDTSLNPSLESAGSVASAMELLDEVQRFGGPGSVAAAAAITTALQSIPGIRRTGYCGLMLPLCEDRRLAELANDGTLRIIDLLSISHVCGVGIDTVPIPGDFSVPQLAAILLDVAAVATRWNKSLSCRVFPVPGRKAGDFTTFDSPYMVNSSILPLE